jgi:hypothetical protein
MVTNVGWFQKLSNGIKVVVLCKLLKLVLNRYNVIYLNVSYGWFPELETNVEKVGIWFC